MVALFRNGLIRLVATLSGRMIGLMVSLSMIIMDYMSTYAHDYYVLDLSLLFHMIKHRGRYLDEMMNRCLH
jgi:hypothetical protein